jgi:hypothetical protein
MHATYRAGRANVRARIHEAMDASGVDVWVQQHSQKGAGAYRGPVGVFSLSLNSLVAGGRVVVSL